MGVVEKMEEQRGRRAEGAFKYPSTRLYAFPQETSEGEGATNTQRAAQGKRLWA
jgi:hypothetical protein